MFSLIIIISCLIYLSLSQQQQKITKTSNSDNIDLWHRVTLTEDGCHTGCNIHYQHTSNVMITPFLSTVLGRWTLCKSRMNIRQTERPRGGYMCFMCVRARHHRQTKMVRKRQNSLTTETNAQNIRENILSQYLRING